MLQQTLCNLIDINSNIPSNCFSARWRFRKLQNFFYRKEFKKAYNFLDKIKNTPENLNTCRSLPKEVITLIFKAIRTRWILKKTIFIWKQKILQKNIKIVNDLSLCLDPIETIDKRDLVSIYYNKTNTTYLFNYKNLLSTFRMRLENSEYGLAKPKGLINPYTNEELTLSQCISIFERFKEILFHKKQRLPTILLLYSKNYSVNKLKQKHNRYIGLLACSNYVKDMSDEQFNLILGNYIEDYFEDRICFECLKNDFKNYREIFQPILINFVSYSNKIISVSKFIKMTKTIIRNYKIIDANSTKHKVRHRQIIKAYRRINTRQNHETRYVFTANRRHSINRSRTENMEEHRSIRTRTTQQSNNDAISNNLNSLNITFNTDSYISFIDFINSRHYNSIDNNDIESYLSHLESTESQESQDSDVNSSIVNSSIVNSNDEQLLDGTSMNE